MDLRKIAANFEINLADLWHLPVTDEVSLVENGAIGAEEGVGVQSAGRVGQGADVENLKEKNSGRVQKEKNHRRKVSIFDLISDVYDVN